MAAPSRDSPMGSPAKSEPILTSLHPVRSFDNPSHRHRIDRLRTATQLGRNRLRRCIS
jgi:hypothetical protein